MWSILSLVLGSWGDSLTLDALVCRAIPRRSVRASPLAGIGGKEQCWGPPWRICRGASRSGKYTYLDVSGKSERHVHARRHEHHGWRGLGMLEGNTSMDACHTPSKDGCTRHAMLSLPTMLLPSLLLQTCFHVRDGNHGPARRQPSRLVSQSMQSQGSATEEPDFDALFGDHRNGGIKLQFVVQETAGKSSLVLVYFYTNTTLWFHAPRRGSAFCWGQGRR